MQRIRSVERVVLTDFARSLFDLVLKRNIEVNIGFYSVVVNFLVR